MEPLYLIATAPFGLESVVSRELRELGYDDQEVQDGKVVFRGDLSAVCRANLWLRSADRVLIRMATFRATDFGELFDRTAELPWADWLPVDAQFPVAGRTIRSQLHSVRTCQAVTKKAIVESLKRKYQRFQFEETGVLFPVEVSLLKDQVTLSMDTTGAGLHKRGYRRNSRGPAPLKETLAAAVIQLSFWNRERPLIDPFCGTGTIPIEAALIARRIAPGLQRTFEAENWLCIPRNLWSEARAEARDLMLPSLPLPLIGTDIDARVLKEARFHAREAGVENDLHLQQRPVSELASKREYGCVITNPPYGERLGDREQVEQMYRELAERFRELETWSLYLLTAYREFERVFGSPSSRRRKLYNGRIECCLYQYYGPRPPRPDNGNETTSESSGLDGSAGPDGPLQPGGSAPVGEVDQPSSAAADDSGAGFSSAPDRPDRLSD